MALSKSAKGARRTKDGRKCSDSFTADGDLVENDCTNASSPDGRSTE